MLRALRIVVITLTVTAGLAGPASAGEPSALFGDNFESLGACLWSAVIAYADGDESESSAGLLSDTSDCDVDAIQWSGELVGADDADYVWFYVDDDFACTSNPVLTISGGPDLQTCAYVSCLAGGTEVACGPGSSSGTSPEGHPGCCTTGGTLDMDYNCVGSFDDIDMYVRHTTASATCASYTVGFQGR